MCEGPFVSVDDARMDALVESLPLRLTLNVKLQERNLADRYVPLGVRTAVGVGTVVFDVVAVGAEVLDRLLLLSAVPDEETENEVNEDWLSLRVAIALCV